MLEVQFFALQRKGLFMHMDAVQLMKPRPYWPFMLPFFLLAGCALIQAWLFMMDAGVKAHALTALF